jgi:predicted HAD superfamily Cof-like phosphohydrolase
MNIAQMIAEFHDALGEPPHGPQLPPPGKEEFRRKLLGEEVGELGDALDERNMVKIADGLADIVYVVFGTAYTYGIPLNAVLEEVHRSNMTKDFGGDGPRKARKGSEYQPPDVAAVLARHGWTEDTK